MGYDLASALVSLRPGSSWSLNGDDYSGLNWQDPNNAPPTEIECKAEMARLRAKHDSMQYARDRARAYPSIQQQLDTLFHQGYEGWHASILEIKNQFPKPDQNADSNT
jgi:hypothetical protein